MIPRRARVAGVTAALLVSAAAAAAVARMLPPRAAPPAGRPDPLVVTDMTAPPRRVIVRVLRGRAASLPQEISITTIFRGPSFTVLADTPSEMASEEDLIAHLRGVFSLRDVVSLGSSRVDLPGGSAVLSDDGRSYAIQVEGQPVGQEAARLVVSHRSEGGQEVATSVVARRGKTIVLTGAAPREDDLLFIALTAY